VRSGVQVSFLLIIFLAAATAEVKTASPIQKPTLASRYINSPKPTAGEEKPIARIVIFGNDNVSDKMILKRFGLKEGDLFKKGIAEQGINRIQELSAVESASLSVIQEDHSKQVRLVIVITEQPTFSIMPIINRNFANKIAVGISLSERNFLNKNHQLSGSFQLRGATIIESDLFIPSFQCLSAAGLRLQLKFRDYHYPYPDYEEYLINDNISRLEGKIKLHIKPGRGFKFYIAPGVDMIKVSEPMLKDQGIGGIPEAPPGFYSTFEMGIELNKRNRNFYPTRGYIFSASRKDWGIIQKGAGIRNFRYCLSSGFFFKTMSFIWNFSASTTLTHGNVPLFLKQHIGGEKTIRGYKYGEFEGNNSMTGRGEVRFPLNFRSLFEPGNPMILVDFNLFADTGACWGRESYPEFNDFHSGFGFGFDFITEGKAMLKTGYAWHLQSQGLFYIDAITIY
jgi:outer membrane protein insertion porin family